MHLTEYNSVFCYRNIKTWLKNNYIKKNTKLQTLKINEDTNMTLKN